MPSLDETGATGLHVAYWHAMWAPKGTPKDIIAKLNAAVVQALADPNVQQAAGRVRARTSGRATQQTPEALAAHHKAETEKWWPIVKATGLKAE